MTTFAELLLLRAAEATAKRTPEDRRLEVLAGLSLARQRAQAADVLWTNGHSAEGLRLAREAFLSALEALEEVQGADAPEDRRAALAAQLDDAGLDASAVKEIVEVSREVEGMKMPRLDEDVTSAQGELWARLVKARRAVDEVLAPAARTPAQIQWSRRRRIGALVGLVALAAVGAYLLFAAPPGVTATASATWSADTGLAQAVIDGDPSTEWMLPDRQTGWIELTLSPPRRIEDVRLLNGHNGGYNDRAVRSAIVEIVAHGEVVRRLTHDWPGVDPAPDWVSLQAGVDDVERIKVLVRGFHREGAALAEIAWD